MNRHRLRLFGMLAGVTVLAVAACATPASPTSAPSAAPTAASKPASAPAAGSPGAAPALTPVIGVSKVPPGPPVAEVDAFAGTPVAQRPPLPAQYAQPVGPYVMSMETIASAAPSQYGLLASPGCAVDSVFKRGMRLIWRFEIVDTKTNKIVTDRDGATVNISLPQNQAKAAVFAPRGGGAPTPDSPWTWVAVWNIPTDFPLGPVQYTVALKTSDGKTTTLTPAVPGNPPLQVVD